MEPRYSTFMVSLDCIFDTRFATLFNMGKEKMLAAFDESYYSRPSDVFPGITREEFKAAYDKRDKSILSSPHPTPIMEMVTQFVLETNANVSTTPYHFVPKIIVNVFPYVLTAEEQRLIGAGISGITNGDADIEIVSMSHEDLTPKFVKKNLSMLVMYDYHLWLELHSVNENFKFVTCPEVTLIGPMLSHNDRPDPAEIIKCDEFGITPYQAIELTVSPLINLKLLPIEHFCLSLKIKKKA